MKKLTKNERAEVISALVVNCNCKDKKGQAAIFNEFDDETLIGLVAPVVNAMDTTADKNAQDEDQEEDETNNEEFDLNEDDGVDMEGDEDAEEDLDDAQSSTKLGFDFSGTGGFERPGQGDKVAKKAGIDNQARGGKKVKQVQNKGANVARRRMTMNEFLSIAPPEFVETWNEAENNKKQMKANLIKQITSNEANTFTKQYLASKDIPELRALAKLANNGRNQFEQPASVPMFNYEGAQGAGGAPFNQMTENEAEDDMYVPELINHEEHANLDPKKMRNRASAATLRA
jgi:hypothetical protein